MLKKLASLGGVAFASTVAGIYALTRPNEERYKSKMPSYKKVSEKVQKWREDTSNSDSVDTELLLRNPEDNTWWRERGTKFKKFYKGDWQDFRDKCFSEIDSKESELHSVFGSNASFYSEADQVPSDFNFLSLCIYKQQS